MKLIFPYLFGGHELPLYKLEEMDKEKIILWNLRSPWHGEYSPFQQ